MAKKASKVTSKPVATKASQTLSSGSTGNTSKSAAGSALSQTGAPKRETSPKAATAASKTLTDGRTSAASKSAAGSALSQTPSKKKG
jgi:hypothetical protein